MGNTSERRAWLGQEYAPWPRRTLSDHFSQLALQFGEHPLLITPERTVTYAELIEEARSIARSMLGMGVRRRDHIALLLGNEPEFLFLTVAASMIGAVAVPLNTMLREDELDYLLAQSDAKWVFVHQSIAGVDHEKAIAAILRAHDGVGDPLAIEQVVVLATTDSPVQEEFQDWEYFRAQGKTIPEAALGARHAISRYPDEVINIIYTSGTTGQPKGVMLTSDMLLRCGYSSALSCV